MNDWVFISKHNQDPFINQFAAGCKSQTIDSETFCYEDNTLPLCFRGILKKKIINQCWKDKRDFYYMDTGYFGNEVNLNNPNGFKIWHRIVKNNLQHHVLTNRPADRWEALKKKIHPWKKTGRKILLAAPDEKPCKFYGLELDKWIQSTVDKIKEFTDRPIEIRQRSKLRIDRTISNTFQSALDNDVYAVVTFNSNAATEAILYGVPAFVLAPVSAAWPVASSDLSKIEFPNYATDDERYQWACHLSYGQFNIAELRSGKAKSLLEELW